MNKEFKRERSLRREKFFRKDQMKKGIYILPNLFTTASLFAGIYAIIASIQGNLRLRSDRDPDLVDPRRA